MDSFIVLSRLAKALWFAYAGEFASESKQGIAWRTG